MARIKFSGLIDSINGSIGGTTIQRNRHGFTVKNKPFVTASLSNFHSKNPAKLAWITSHWRTLSEQEQNAWKAYAATYQTNTRNDSAKMISGYDLFVQANMIRQQNSGQALISNISAGPYQVPKITFTIENTASVLTIDLDGAVPNPSFLIYVRMSRPLPASTSKPRFSTRYIRFFAFTGPVSGINITALYSAIYGGIPSVGERVQLDCTTAASGSPSTYRIPPQLITVT